MKCIICNSKNTKFLLKPHRGRSIFICNNCNNAFTYPTPKVVYNQHEFYRGGQEEEMLYRSYAKPIIEFISKFKKRGRLLDVGTGSGCLVAEAIKSGFNAEGIEASNQAVAYCRNRGLKVSQGYFEENSYDANSFDVIVMSHVLEHSLDPLKFIQAAYKILKPGGLLCLSQTNYQGSIPKLLGPFWEGWVPNEHITHFLPKGVKYFLEKQRFILEEIIIIPLGYFPQWKWGGFSTLANNLYQSVNYFISKFRLIPSFIGDQMYIAAKKL